MTLRSGADVKIGSREFFLDDTAQEPYAHVLVSLYSDTQKIAGMDATTADPNVLLWPYDDFAGGVENKYYSELIPDTWWYGNANPRVRGSITAPPDTTLTNLTMATAADKAFFVAVGGKLWLGVGRDVYYSDAGETWSRWNGAALFAAGYTIDGMSHDGACAWVTAANGSTRKTRKVLTTTTETTAVEDHADTGVMFGMAMLEGQVYAWNGAALFKYDSTETLPIIHDDLVHKVHQPFSSGGEFGGIAASDNSIIYFTAGNGFTEVFEWRFSSSTSSFIPRPIWKPSPGFTARFMVSTMGVFYLLGDWVDQAAIFGMSAVNREPLFLSYVGQAFGGSGNPLTPTALCGSYGTSVLVGMTDGDTNYYFVYDAELDSLTPLDQQATSDEGLNLAVSTYRNRRVAVGSVGTTGKARWWKQDFDTPTRSWEWVSSGWNLGYPMDEKLLFGFEVVQDPTIAAGQIQVLYQKDEDGSWVSAGTTAAGVKYTNLDKSTDNVKFRNLRVRMLGTAGARCFSITARTYINAYQELWRLVVKMRDEDPTNRPATRQARAAKLREWLNELAKAKSVVTFLDGRVNPAKGKYSTHTVVVEFANYGGQRIARAQGHYEGAAEIQLRSTTPTGA